MTNVDPQVLKLLAQKYVWWKTPDEALQSPQRIIAQVMDIGDYADVQLLSDRIGETAFRDALMQAEAGQFNERSWTYWHYRLGLSEVDQVPPLPERRFQ